MQYNGSQDLRRSAEATKDGEISLQQQNAQSGARRHSQDMRRVSQDARRAPVARPADVHVSQDARRVPVPQTAEEPRARLDEPNVSHNDFAFGIA